MRVNNVIDNTLQREQKFSRKKCTKTEAEIMFKSTLHEQTNSTHIPRFTTKHQQNIFNDKIKKAVRNKTREATQEKLVARANSLKVQGNMLSIVAKEKVDILWKSSVFDLKSGTVKFMMNASIDTLPTPVTLKRYNY